MTTDPTPTHPLTPRRFLAGAAMMIFAVWVAFQQPADEALYLYCAHDARFAQEILNRFTDETGIEVKVHFDSESTKSLGLIEQIKSEGNSPQADVFWNNEFLGSLDLAQGGYLQPYQGSGWQRIPEAFRDPEGLWTGFGARLRVWAVNTNLMEASVASIRERLQSDDLSRVGLAKPLYGTTLTHYSALWHERGSNACIELHTDRLNRGLRILNGNAVTCNLAGDGVLDLAFTDTDDAFVSLDQNKPLAMIPVELESGHTLVIPNTVGILKGARQLEKAQIFVDYLLSERIELALANGASRQVPLGPVSNPDGRLPAEVMNLLAPTEKGLPLHDLLQARQECLTWLKDELP